jgi:hypothetical protein
VGSIDAPSTIKGCIRNACTNFTIITIPIIQTRRDDGASSSSRSLIETSASRVFGEKIAMISAITMSVRIPKMDADTGFSIMSEIELKILCVRGENIMSISI